MFQISLCSFRPTGSEQQRQQQLQHATSHLGSPTDGTTRTRPSQCGKQWHWLIHGIALGERARASRKQTSPGRTVQYTACEKSKLVISDSLATVKPTESLFAVLGMEGKQH